MTDFTASRELRYFQFSPTRTVNIRARWDLKLSQLCRWKIRSSGMLCWRLHICTDASNAAKSIC
jgi:hypothetical protein